MDKKSPITREQLYKVLEIHLIFACFGAMLFIFDLFMPILIYFKIIEINIQPPIVVLYCVLVLLPYTSYCVFSDFFKKDIIVINCIGIELFLLKRYRSYHLKFRDNSGETNSFDLAIPYGKTAYKYFKTYKAIELLYTKKSGILIGIRGNKGHDERGFDDLYLPDSN